MVRIRYRLLISLFSYWMLIFSADAAEKVVLQLRWDHQFQFAGYYSALWNGYFEAEGLDVEIRSAVQSMDNIRSAIKEVSDGRADFGVGSADIILADDKAQNLTVIASIFQTSAAGFYALKGTKLNHVTDLLDLKVARRPNDLIDVELQAMLLAEGVNPDRIESHQHQSGIGHLTSGRVDVIPGYRISVPFSAGKLGIELTRLLPSSYGIDFYGDSLFANTALVENNPDLVQRFKRAAVKGWEYALSHPIEVATRISRDLPRTAPVVNADKLGFNTFQSDGVKELALYPLVQIGHTNASRWRRMHSTLKELGLVKNDFDEYRFIFNPELREQVKIENIKKFSIFGVSSVGFVILLIILWSLSLRKTVSARTKEIELLNLITTIANEASSVEEALRDTLEVICIFTGWPVGHAYRQSMNAPGFLESSGDWYIAEGQEFKALKAISTRTGFASGQGLPGRVLSSGEAEWIDDVNTDPNFPRNKSGEHLKVKGAFAFPVFAKGEVVAVLEFFSRDSVRIRTAKLDEALNHIGVQLGRVLERAKFENELLASKMDAEEVNRAKSEFLASMSHELRTPLNAVLGFAQMLQFDPNNPLTEKQEEHINSILAGGNHLLELVNEVLDLAKIESDRAPFLLDEVNVNEIVTACVEQMKPLGLPQKIRIDDQISEGPPTLLRTDALRLKQILINLLSNAIKYNKYGGSVTIAGRPIDGDLFHLSISDTGIGIDEKDQNSVFQLFHRLSSDAMIAKEGSGIGLHVTKLLLDRMGGQIGIDSELGVGSTFWINLPLISNQETIIWTDNLRVGVDPIDKDHQVVISLLNKMTHRSINDADLDKVIEEMIEYTRYHFRREETIMRVTGYPDFAPHVRRHRKLIKQVTDLDDAWRKDRDPKILQELLQFLRSWWIGHILEVDTGIAQYAAGKDREIRDALKSVESLST